MQQQTVNNETCESAVGSPATIPFRMVLAIRTHVPAQREDSLAIKPGLRTSRFIMKHFDLSALAACGLLNTYSSDRVFGQANLLRDWTRSKSFLRSSRLCFAFPTKFPVLATNPAMDPAPCGQSFQCLYKHPRQKRIDTLQQLPTAAN